MSARLDNRGIGAQCMMCKHAQWRGNLIVGCQRFEGAPVGEIGMVLQAVLFQLAGDRKCVARERLDVGPDAYFARDIGPGPVGRRA